MTRSLSIVGDDLRRRRAQAQPARSSRHHRHLALQREERREVVQLLVGHVEGCVVRVGMVAADCGRLSAMKMMESEGPRASTGKLGQKFQGYKKSTVRKDRRNRRREIGLGARSIELTRQT